LVFEHLPIIPIRFLYTILYALASYAYLFIKIPICWNSTLKAAEIPLAFAKPPLHPSISQRNGGNKEGLD